jgi:predicted permease
VSATGQDILVVFFDFQSGIYFAVRPFMLQEVRQAIRGHIRQPKLALIMIVTLALGIGAATSVFTVVRAVLLRSLSYEHPEQLVRLFESNPAEDATYFSVSIPNWRDWQTHTRTFQDLAALTRPQDVNLIRSGQSIQASGTRISSNLLPVLGIQTVFGRNFHAAADRPGSEFSVMLNYDFWKSQFGSDPTIVGHTIQLDNKPYEVIGITPSGFHLPFADSQMYLPLSPAQFEMKRSHHFLRVIGRLQSGVTLNQGLDEMKTIAAALAEQYQDSNRRWSITGKAISEIVVPQNSRRGLWILFGAVGFVLLISCLNVANLLTSQIIARRREISIRRALGADGSRLFSQFLAESFFIALLAGAAGIFLASSFVQMLRTFEPDIPRLQEISIDPLVFAFTLGISCFTVLIFGTIAAWQGAHRNVHEDLKEGNLTGTPGAGKIWIRKALVVTEASLSIVLVIGAGLLIRSFLHLHSLDPGFHPDHVLSVRLTLPVEKSLDPSEIRTFYDRILDRLQGQPGIQHAAIANNIPFGLGNAMEEFTIEGQEGKPYAAAYRIVTPDYFAAMEIPVLHGRTFETKTAFESAHSVVIDEMARRRFWPDENPMGKVIHIKGIGAFQIRAIVGEVRSLSLYEDPLPSLYLSIDDVDSGAASYLVVRSSGNPMLLSGSLREAIREANPDAVIGTPTPINSLVSESLSERSFSMWILSIFAAVALILAAVGLYSVIAYSVSQRTHEIGIRMALGAKYADVIALIVKQGLLLAVLGVSIGLFASLGVTRLLTSSLFLISPTDSVTFQAAAVLFLFIALIASYFPARRAALLDPVVALKQE